jgi:hypothetical protein
MADHDILMAYLRSEFARLNQKLDGVEPHFPPPDDGGVENLGRVAPWQIREFPDGLRRELIDEARKRRVSVSEFVTAYMVLLRNLNWPDPKLIHLTLVRRTAETDAEPLH